MSERVRDILVGLTMIVGAIGLVVILTLFGYVPRWLQDGYVLAVSLNHAAGLSEGSRVHLSGIDIGAVREVRLAPAPAKGVLVSLFLEADARVPQAAEVGVEAPIIGGSPTLTFDVEHLEPPQLLQHVATDGTGRVAGRVPSLASRFAEELRASLQGPMDRFNDLSAQWTEVARNLNALIEPRTLAQVDAGQEMGNLTTVLTRADARMAELKTTIEGLNRWAGDEQLQADVHTTISGAAAAVDSFKAGAERWGQLGDEVSAQLARLTGRYAAVADDLSGAIGSVREAVEKASHGEGAVGRLLADPALYENLNDAAQRLDAALKELQLLIQKWAAEGVPVRL